MRRILVLAALLAVAGCAETDTTSTPAPDPDDMTVGTYLDLSIPEEDRVVERFYETDHADECPNVDYRGISSEFRDRIRSRALGAEEGSPMREVLIQFCDRP